MHRILEHIVGKISLPMELKAYYHVTPEEMSSAKSMESLWKSMEIEAVIEHLMDPSSKTINYLKKALLENPYLKEKQPYSREDLKSTKKSRECLKKKFLALILEELKATPWLSCLNDFGNAIERITIKDKRMEAQEQRRALEWLTHRGTVGMYNG